MKDTPYPDTPYCKTDIENTEVCDIPKCTSSKINIDCLMTVSYSISSKSLTIKWSKTSDNRTINSYTILLYNSDNICEKYEVQKCDKTCDETFSKNFYLSCKYGRVRDKITLQTTWYNLIMSKTYNVYIIPAFTTGKDNDVMRIVIDTKLKKPSKPSNLKLVTVTLRSLSFKWSDSTENNRMPSYYSARVTKQGSVDIIQNITQSKVTFSNLNACSKYCVEIIAINDVGRSEPSDKVCSYTLASSPGSVIIDHVGVISPSSRIISWKNLGKVECPISYWVEYSTNLGSVTKNIVIRDFPFVVLENLKENVIYAVKVKAQTINNTFPNGSFSKIKYFYTGQEKPAIGDYREYFSKTTMNVSWTLDKPSKESVFEFIVRLRDSLDNCLRSVNLICSSCRSIYNRINLKPQDKNKIKLLMKCQNKKSIPFDSKKGTFGAILEDVDQLAIFSVDIYAINLMGVHKVLSKTTRHQPKEAQHSPVSLFEEIIHYLDFRKIFNMQHMNKIKKYEITSKNFKVRSFTNLNDSSSVSCSCFFGELNILKVELERNHKVFIVPFNFTCGMKESIPKVRNLEGKYEEGSLSLYWNVTTKGNHKYLVFWMNSEDYLYQYFESQDSNYVLKNVRIFPWQQICLATIDQKWRTSKYTCNQYSEYPAPVINLRAYSTSKEMFISWENSKEDDHHAYLVNITDPNGRCQSIIINMKQYCLKVKSSCRYKRTLRWESLKVLHITRYIFPRRRYNVRVSSLRANYSSIPTSIIVTTKKQGFVKDLKVFGNSSYIRINFSPPVMTDNMNLTYRVKVSLHCTQICSFKHKVIFDEVIAETSIIRPILYFQSCLHYEVDVLPIPQCQTHNSFSKKDILEIDFVSVSLHGSLFDVSRKYSKFDDLSVTILSKNLLELSWKNKIPDNDCNNFGFIVNLTRRHNDSDCKGWIITRTTCTTLINEVNKISICQNKVYLKYNSALVSTSLILHGDFKVSSSYRVDVWIINDKTKQSYSKEIKFENEEKCLQDCQSSDEIKHQLTREDLCQKWKASKRAIEHLNNKQNMCGIDLQNKLIYPICYNGSSLMVDCFHRTCQIQPKENKCITKFNVKSSKESIEVQFSDFSGKEETKGHIFMLHYTNNTCVASIFIGCSNCLTLRLLEVEIQKLFHTCSQLNFYSNGYKIQFSGLKSNTKYFLYVIPLVSSYLFGLISNLTVSTLLEEPFAPNYINVEDIQNTSLKFFWKSYKGRNNRPFFDNYVTTLINMKSKEEYIKNSTQEMAQFHQLDTCTQYCFYLSIVDKDTLSELVDSVCTYTKPSSLGQLILKDIEPGTHSKRDISWTYSGGDDCQRIYEVETYSNISKNPKVVTTRDTHKVLDGFIENTVYRVRVKMKTYVFKDEKVNLEKYSEMKVFYTSKVENSLPHVELKISSNRTYMSVFLFSFDQTLGSMFEFIVGVYNEKHECLRSIIFWSVNDYKEIFINPLWIKEWETYAKCDQSVKKTYKNFGRDTFTFSKALGNIRATIHGLSIFGIQKFYDEVL